MKIAKSIRNLTFLLASAAFLLYIAGCSDSSVTSDNQTDDQYLQEVVNAGIGSSNQEEGDLMYSEAGDLDDGGAVGGGNGDTPIDSLYKWGRKVTGVNINLNITNEGDSLRIVNVTRTINGNFIIIGTVNNVLDTIIKPYTEVLKRYAVFKRIAHTNRPRYNWKLYKVSMVDGQSTSPQIGSDYVQMNKIEVYVNNVLAYTFNGPDFTQNVFITKKFGGQIPLIHIGDQVRLKVFTFSKQSEKDIVAWHWARNTFGFHRIPFDMTSETPNGQYWNRTYEKSFTIYPQHRFGLFNGFISASTHKSLYDDSPSEFASDLVGMCYGIVP